MQPFVTRFRNEFKTDPEIYAFRGYDVACYVTDMLENYGNSLRVYSLRNVKIFVLPVQNVKKAGWRI